MNERKNAHPAGFRAYLRTHSDTAVKVALSTAAVLMGVGAILAVVYAVLPNVLGNAAELLEMDIAAEMYQETLDTAENEVPLPTARPQAEAVFEQPVPQAAPAPTPRNQFASVLAQNPEIVGRVSVPPNIQYLVTQTSDNEYYIKHGYRREESKSGAVFLDYRCDPVQHPLSGHYILYGHHMKNGSMLAPLMAYKEEDYFREHRAIRFDTLAADYEWEIFSAYVSDTDFYFIDTAFDDDVDWLTFLYTIRAKSAFKTDIHLSPADVVLTLVTCTYEFDDARFVVHAKLVK